MAKPSTPTIKEITKKLQRTGFRKVQRESVLTKQKPPHEEHEKVKKGFPQLALKEPKAVYSKKKK